MKFSVGASLAAMLLLSTGTVMAGSAVLNDDMTAFGGPGDNYPPVLHLVAGQRIDVHECDMRQWCRVEHDGIVGWVHAILAKPAPATAAGQNKPSDGPNSTSVANSDTVSGGDSGGGGSKGGSSRSGGMEKGSFLTGDGGSRDDAISVLAGRDGSTGGSSGGGSTTPASIASDAATYSGCRAC